MTKPVNVEILDANLVDLEEHPELAVGVSVPLRLRVTHAGGQKHKTGILLRHFVKVDGIPVATVQFVHDDSSAEMVVKEASVRALKGTQQSIRVLAWERDSGPREIAATRVRVEGVYESD